MERVVRKLWCAVALMTLLASCARQSSDPQSLPDSLIVLPGASKIRITDRNSAVSYELQVTYPAQEVIDSLARQLTEKGWKALETALSNPSASPSASAGWGSYIDGTQRPETNVYQWIGQWQDRGGNVAWYTLRYETVIKNEPVRRPEGPLHVIAKALSPDEVKLLRSMSK
jgi:hypothetical protein